MGCDRSTLVRIAVVYSGCDCYLPLLLDDIQNIRYSSFTICWTSEVGKDTKPTFVPSNA